MSLPAYEGPPEKYLNREPDQIARRNFSDEFFRKKVRDNADFLGTLAVPPYIQDGKIIGMKVLRDPKDAFWKRTGLKKDDVLISINQKPINQLFTVLQKENSPFEILFLRKTKLIRLILDVK